MNAEGVKGLSNIGEEGERLEGKVMGSEDRVVGESRSIFVAKVVS